MVHMDGVGVNIVMEVMDTTGEVAIASAGVKQQRLDSTALDGNATEDDCTSEASKRDTSITIDGINQSSSVNVTGPMLSTTSTGL